MEVPRTALPSSDSSMQTSARAGTQPNVTGDDSTAIATLNETPSQPPTAGDTDDTTIRTSMPRNEELEQMLQWQPGEFSDDDEEEDRRWQESWNNLNDTRYNMYNVWSDLTARSQELTAQLNELSANVQQTTMMLQTLRHNFASTNEVLGIAASDAVRQNISSENSSDFVGQNISSDNPSDPVGQSAKGTEGPDTIEQSPRSAEEEAIMAQARALYQRDFGNDENAVIRAREETDERIQRLPPQLQEMVQWFTEELERCSTPEIAEAVVKLDHMRQAYRSTENRQSTPAIAEMLTRTQELPHTLLCMTPEKHQRKAKRRSKQDNELVAAASKIHRREWGDTDIDQWLKDTEEERKNLPSEYQAARARLAGVMDRCSTPEVAALIIEFDELKQHRPSTPEVVALMNSFSDKYQPAAEREASRTTALLAKTPKMASTPFHRTSAISVNTDAHTEHDVEDDKRRAIASKVFQKSFEELRSEALSICRRDTSATKNCQVTEEPARDFSPEEVEDKAKFDKEMEQWTDKELAAAVVFIEKLRQSRDTLTPPPSTSQAGNEETPAYHELQKVRPRRHLHGLSRMELTTICSEVLTFLACDNDFLRDEWLTVLHILVEHGFPESFLRNIKDVYVLADFVVLRSAQHPTADFWFSLRNIRSMQALEYVAWLAGHNGEEGLWNCHYVHILETLSRRPTATFMRYLKKVDIRYGLSFPQEQQFYEGTRPKASVCHRLLRNLTEPREVRGVPSLTWAGLPNLQYRLLRVKEWVRYAGQGQFADSFRAYYSELPAGEPTELTPRNFVQFQPPANVTNDDMVIQTWLTNPPVAILWQLPDEREQCTVLETKAHCSYPTAPAYMLEQVLDLTAGWTKLRKLRFEVRWMDDSMASEFSVKHDIGIFCQDLVDAFFIRLLNVIRQSTRNIEIDVAMLGEFEIWGGDDEDHETAKQVTKNRFAPWNVTIPAGRQAIAKMSTAGPNFTATLNIHYISMSIGSSRPTPPPTFQRQRDRLHKLIEDQKYDA